MDSSLCDEKTMLVEIASGNEPAFKKFFDLYKERFYAVSLKMTGSDAAAQDIVQDVFVNIWNKRESLVDVENPSSYFFTVLYRRVYRYYRKGALEKKLLQGTTFSKESVNTTDDMVLAHESEKLISMAIDKLPPQQKIVFKLSKQEGLSREDIARQLDISPHTVRNHLSDALKSIRNFLVDSAIILLLII